MERSYFFGGVFLPGKALTENLDMRFLLRAVLAWLLSAAALLLLASLIVSKSSLGEGVMGYVSSAISFLAACFAGSAAARRGSRGGLYVGLVSAAALTVALLTVGFIIEGTGIQASAVLSVVSFTFSGCLVGSVFLRGRRTKSRKTGFSPRLRG